jgi:NAD(P)-dependent dehydrogenase (short-subunit alcohol dehydrogenase family)
VNDTLKDKVAVVTGATGVLCSQVAIGLAARGAKVAVLGRNTDRAEAVVKRIEDSGGIAAAFLTDVMDRESLEGARDRILDTYSTIDILINGAGGNRSDATTGPENSFFDLSLNAIKEVSDLNFLGTILPSQVFGKVLAEKQGGTILNVSSMAAYSPLTKTVAYSGAKAAVSNFTQWLAVHMNQEYSPKIRVNALAPGFFSTQQNKYLLYDKDSGELTPRGQTIIDHTPMGRFGDPADLVGLVVFLCTEDAAFITGTVIPVDGGFNAFSGV